jgi:hypothetical protein
MTFASIEALSSRLRELGATRIFCKALAENDNTKQQIYLGGSFEVIQLLPHRDVHTDAGVKRPNFKAALNMAWVDDAGNVALAPGAQLILYPDYPEVRLSGFVRGCPTAPSRYLQPVSKESRKFNNGPDGRVLFFGVGSDDIAHAYLAIAESPVATEFAKRRDSGEFELDGVLWQLPVGRIRNPRGELLTRLRAIHGAGWHFSQKMDGAGNVNAYTAQNGGGYTLESLLGIRPNASITPDFMGWEVKAYSSNKVTLITTEPDVGYYGKHGVKAFVRKYGHDAGNDVLYFTGIHRAETMCDRTGQTLRLRGFDAQTRKIVDVEGGVELFDANGSMSAGWSFQHLIDRWSRKHSAAVYVPYTRKKVTPPEYQYNSPVLMGEGTDITMYLGALAAGLVMFDPGSKVMAASTTHSSVKPRSQFRIPIQHLSSLYSTFEAVEL